MKSIISCDRGFSRGTDLPQTTATKADSRINSLCILKLLHTSIILSATQIIIIIDGNYTVTVYSFMVTIRGHSYKVFIVSVRTNLLKKSFISHRVLDSWNRLPQVLSMQTLCRHSNQNTTDSSKIWEIKAH